MTYKCLPFLILLLLHYALAKAQGPIVKPKDSPTQVLEKKVTSLTQYNNQLRGKLALAALENQQLQTQITGLQKVIESRNDSITRQLTRIEGLNDQIAQLTTKNQQLLATIDQRTTELKAANTRIVQLEYDRKVLIDSHIIRIYNFSADDVRKEFIHNLSAPESGFQYDDGLIDDEIQITRNFGDQAEAWWVFDKTLDTILELKIRIKPHLYDPQKAIVFGETKLLQKTRYSNKPFEEQHDREKVGLYREKTLHMLEGKLSGTSDK
ncbi:hypothetical protein GO730_15685 [Spirosoma sp. HMF3257]|uniref:Uncharacterized protein n=1 Tax=Spirosoma telluris TaxID=2183553 RepID=A0A327NLL5_9BACT|nr:hypothetical protein [Spirosoma telluris]RAI75259.1 hypothetical protein HMF3257_15635 [Spirosoma telluris]